MGDIGFEVNSGNTRALSPLEFYPNLSTVSLFSPIAPTMQDDMLMDKSTGKQQLLQQLSPNPADLSPDSSDLSPGSKSKSGGSSPLTVPDKNKAVDSAPNVQLTSSPSVLQQQLAYNHEAQGTTIGVNSAPTTSVFSTPSLWSTAGTAEETFFQGLPAMNHVNGMQFQNFPLNSSPLFSPTLPSPTPAQLASMQQQQRRSLPPQHQQHQQTPQQQTLFPTTMTTSQLQQAQAQQLQQQSGNLFLPNHANKQGYTTPSWNTQQQQQQQAQQQQQQAQQSTSWSSPAQQAAAAASMQSNPWGTVGSPPAPATNTNMANQQRRSMPPMNMPGQATPGSISPLKARGPSNPVISPPKFHRSTSLPGKGYSQPPLASTMNAAPNYEFTREHPKRDFNTNTLFPYQVSS